MKKKKIISLILVLLFIHLCFPFLLSTTRVSAQESADVSGMLNESVVELIGQLDLQALQDYVNSLGAFEGQNVGERLIEYIQGESFDYENFGRELLEVLFANVRETLPAFACIAAIALLSGIMSTLKSGTAGSAVGNMIFLISYAAALIPLIGVLCECFEKTFHAVSEMQRQMQIVYPILLTLMAASGGTVSVVMCRPAVAFFSNTIVSVINGVVFPLTVTVVAFSMAGNLSTDLKISKFNAFFKSINKWVFGVCISIFGLFFTLQGLTASVYDGVVRRAAKYAIGNGVPIVGGFLSGGFDLAVAGGILIKNSLGSMSLFLMVSVIFEPVVMLISVNVLLRFTAAITQPFGDSKISDFLGETASNLHYCTAGLLFTAFLYFLSIVMMVSASEALL